MHQRLKFWCTTHEQPRVTRRHHVGSMYIIHAFSCVSRGMKFLWSFFLTLSCVAVDAYSTHDRLLCVGVTKLRMGATSHKVWIIHESRAVGVTGLFWVKEHRVTLEVVFAWRNKFYWIPVLIIMLVIISAFLERIQQHSHLSLFRCSQSLQTSRLELMYITKYQCCTLPLKLWKRRNWFTCLLLHQQ